MVDYVTLFSSAVIVASLIIMGSLLARYSKLVQEADKSTRLAKDVWDSVNSRFSVVDARIIDLMAKTEVLSSKLATSQVPFQARVPSSSTNVTTPALASVDVQSAPAVSTPPVAARESTETEAKVLRLLAAGPKSSAQIKDVLGKSREHTARLMKGLFDRGLVVRNDRNKPYVYEITEAGKSYVAS